MGALVLTGGCGLPGLLLSPPQVSVAVSWVIDLGWALFRVRVQETKPHNSQLGDVGQD